MAQAAVRGNATRDAEALDAEPRRGLECPIQERLHDHALKTGGDVGDEWRLEVGGWRLGSHEPRHGGLQSAEAEIDAAFDRWRQQPGWSGRRRLVAIRVRHARKWKIEG